MNLGDYYPKTQKRLIFITPYGKIFEFQGKSILGVCYVYGDPKVFAEGYEVPYEYCSSSQFEAVFLANDVKVYALDMNIIRSCQTWKQVSIMTGINQLADLKRVIRSVYPIEAYYLDVGVDLEGYEILECEFYIPKQSSNKVSWYGIGGWAYDKKIKAKNGQNILLRVTVNEASCNSKYVENYANKLYAPVIVYHTPFDLVVLSENIKFNGNVHGLVSLTLAVPPKEKK